MAGVDSERTGQNAERGVSAKSTNSDGKSSVHGRKFGAELSNDAESQVSSHRRYLVSG